MKESKELALALEYERVLKRRLHISLHLHTFIGYYYYFVPLFLPIRLLCIFYYTYMWLSIIVYHVQS